LDCYLEHFFLFETCHKVDLSIVFTFTQKNQHIPSWFWREKRTTDRKIVLKLFFFLGGRGRRVIVIIITKCLALVSRVARRHM
jgi:hypothetical protein